MILRARSLLRTRFLLSSSLALLAGAIAGCDDSLDLGNAGAPVGVGGAGAGGTANVAGAAGKAGQAGTAGTAAKGGSDAGAGGSEAGAGGSEAGAGGSEAGAGGSEAGAGGSEAGASGSDAGTGGSEAGAAGSDAGVGGSDAGAAGADAGAGGSDAGAGGSDAGAGGSDAGSGGADAGVGGSSAGAGGSSAGAGGIGGAGGSAGASGGSGGSAGGAGSGGAGGAPLCGDAAPKVSNLCAVPVTSPPTAAGTKPCWTRYAVPPAATPSCFTPANLGQDEGDEGELARFMVTETSRVVVWRERTSGPDTGGFFGLATDECSGAVPMCLGFDRYLRIATAEVPPGTYQVQSRQFGPLATYFLVEPPPPAPTNVSCASATPILETIQNTQVNDAFRYLQQPRVVDAQSRHFSFQETALGQTRSVRVRSEVNAGKITVRLRASCGGAIVAEETSYFGPRAVFFTSTQGANYQIEVIAEEGVQFGMAVAGN